MVSSQKRPYLYKRGADLSKRDESTDRIIVEDQNTDDFFFTDENTDRRDDNNTDRIGTPHQKRSEHT